MKCGMRQIITIICVTHVQKNFKIRTLIKQLFTKYQFLTKLSQISHIHKNHNFSSIIGRFKTNCFYPINFMVGTCEEYSFIFASCEPFNDLRVCRRHQDFPA